MIHDENNEAKVGDIVTAIECRPMSKNKSFRVKSVKHVEVIA
jgi:small subunit ribosomal protein S17